MWNFNLKSTKKKTQKRSYTNDYKHFFVNKYQYSKNN